MPPNAIALYALYALFFSCSAVLVAVSAKQIDFNLNVHNEKYVPILQELLVTAAMSVIWIPVTLATILTGSGITSWVSFEVIGAIWLWVQHLVGAAYWTAHEYKNKGDCDGFSTEECNISTSVLAFSWIGFSLMTFISILSITRASKGSSLKKLQAGV